MASCSYQTCSEVPFEYISFFLEKVSTAKIKRKAAHLQAFREKYVQRASDDIYQIYRLLLPQLDKHRGNYLLKEAKLASALIRACGLDAKVSRDAQCVQNWKKYGTVHAGNFAAVTEEYLFRKHCGKMDGTPGVLELSVGDLNCKLDELANSEESSVKTGCLRWLIVRTSPKQMQWIVQIILKDVKAGLSETRLFRDFHPDAEHLYNVTMDLERVCKELRDANKRYPRKDVQPGDAARPQLAARADSTDAAMRKLHGVPFVVEVKFDGERVQLHRDGSQYWYFSRRGKEHGAQSVFNVFNSVATDQLKHNQCILDGEMIVWNSSRKSFEPFGTLRTAVLSANNNTKREDFLEMDNSSDSRPGYECPKIRDIVLIYIAFDILFVKEESVINRSLKERHSLLAASINTPSYHNLPCLGGSGLRGTIAPLLPGVEFLSEPPFSKAGNSLRDIQEMYDMAIERQEEGIVVKALDSQWRLNDRNGSWLKIKPDYVCNHDIDAVIIGCCYGTGRNGGKISEFLLGLLDATRIDGNGNPASMVSFCRVATGMSDSEKAAIRDKLNDNLLKPGCAAPKCYRISGHSKEKPDTWVKDPFSSIVLQVKADIRTIVSKVFAAAHSLRFPRVDRVRWDKAPMDAMKESELVSLVSSNKGSLEDVSLAKKLKTKKKTILPSPIKTNKPAIISYLAPTRLAGVEIEENVLRGAPVCFLNYEGHSKRELELCVRRLGGVVYVGVTPSVKYVLASHNHCDYKVKGLVKSGERDILSVDWLLACSKEKRLVPPRPRDYIFRAPSEKSLFDILLDHPLEYDFDSEDMKSILSWGSSYEVSQGNQDSQGSSVEELMVDLKASLPLPRDKFSLLRGLCFMFVPSLVDNERTHDLAGGHGILSSTVRTMTDVINIDAKVERDWENSELALWEQTQLDVRICGGCVSENMTSRVTHLVTLDQDPPHRSLLEYLRDKRSKPEDFIEIRGRLQAGALRIVNKRWIQTVLTSESVEIAGPDDTSSWPWDEFCTTAKRKRKVKGINAVKRHCRKSRKVTLSTEQSPRPRRKPLSKDAVCDLSSSTDDSKSSESEEKDGKRENLRLRPARHAGVLRKEPPTSRIDLKSEEDEPTDMAQDDFVPFGEEKRKEIGSFGHQEPQGDSGVSNTGLDAANSEKLESVVCVSQSPIGVQSADEVIIPKTKKASLRKRVQDALRDT